MPSPYRALFSAPGAMGFSAAGFLGRLPISMMGVGIVTMLSQLTGRYGLAGAVAATLALSSAAIGPWISRLVDRHGQRRVLRPATVVAVVAGAGLLLSAHQRWPDWTLFLCAALTSSVPSLGSMVRARWATLHQDTPERLHTAYAFESVIDEMCFIVGPILAIGLSTTWFPEAGPLVAGCSLLIGVLALTAQRSTEPVPHPLQPGDRGSALRSPGLRVLVCTFAATGVIFGATDVVTVAFAAEHGHKAWASLLLATYAAGSCLAGVVFGLLRLTGAPARRWLCGVCAMAASMIPLQLVGNLPALALVLFVAGMSVAPTMVTTMALVAQHVRPARLTEGMTWTSTGLAVGVAVGSAAAGEVVDRAGAAAAYAVPGVAGALAAALAFAGYRRLSQAPVRCQEVAATPLAEGHPPPATTGRRAGTDDRAQERPDRSQRDPDEAELA